MNKIWAIGYGLFVLGKLQFLAAVVGGFVGLPVCLLWWPGEVQGLLWHITGTVMFAMGLSVAGYVLSRLTEKRENER